MIHKMEVALHQLKTREAEERLRGDIKELVRDMTKQKKEQDKLQRAADKQAKLVDTTAEEVRRRFRLLEWTREQNATTSKGILEAKAGFKAKYDSYWSGARLCLRDLHEPVIAQFSSFLKPPELLDWAVTALFMVVTGLVKATPWHDVRGVQCRNTSG